MPAAEAGGREASGGSGAAATGAALTLVLGGARSGKSRHAEALVAAHAPPFAYLATGQAFDAEMTARIRHHRERRDARWQTLEAPLDLAGALRALPPGRPALVDCLTLWLSNRLLAGDDLDAAGDELLAALRLHAAPLVLVSNEVGLGIVPDNALARGFRDAAGILNQRVAALAGTVVFVAAGLPLRLKG